jgi:hypothetical protein
MSATVYHMVHYRRFKVDWKGGKSSTLEALCREALNTENNDAKLWARPADRVFDVGDDDDGRKIILNKVADLSSAVFGEMCLAQAKDLQALLSMNPSEVKLSDLTTATVYDLNERTAPTGSQFVRGLAYWLIIGDHVLFIKTHSMTPDLVQQYLDWLLRSRGPAANPVPSFTLNAELDKTATAGDIGEIRSLRLAGKSVPQVVSIEHETERRTVKTSRRIAERFAEMQQAIPIMNALFGAVKAQSLVDSLGPEEYLAVEAAVKVRGRRTEESRKRFQALANDLADQSDAKVQIEGKDGRIVNGDAILRTRMPFDLPYDGSNLLEFDNVADQLQEVYARFVKDGKIKA